MASHIASAATLLWQLQWPLWLAWYLLLPLAVIPAYSPRSSSLERDRFDIHHLDVARNVFPSGDPHLELSPLNASNVSAPTVLLSGPGRLNGAQLGDSYLLTMPAVPSSHLDAASRQPAAAAWLPVISTCLMVFTPVTMLIAAAIASWQLRRDRCYQAILGTSRPPTIRALLLLCRVAPTAIISLAMLPHQACSWFEGILTASAEFETTPKDGSMAAAAVPDVIPAATLPVRAANGTGSIPAQGATDSATVALPTAAVMDGRPTAALAPPLTGAKPLQRARVHWCVVAELSFVVYSLASAAHSARVGLLYSSQGSAFAALAVGSLCCFYADAGPVLQALMHCLVDCGRTVTQSSRSICYCCCAHFRRRSVCTHTHPAQRLPCVLKPLQRPLLEDDRGVQHSGPIAPAVGDADGGMR